MAKSELSKSKRENELLKEIQIKDKSTITKQRYIALFFLLLNSILRVNSMTLVSNEFSNLPS